MPHRAVPPRVRGGGARCLGLISVCIWIMLRSFVRPTSSGVTSSVSPLGSPRQRPSQRSVALPRRRARASRVPCQCPDSVIWTPHSTLPPYTTTHHHEHTTQTHHTGTPRGHTPRAKRQAQGLSRLRIAESRANRQRPPILLCRLLVCFYRGGMQIEAGHRGGSTNKRSQPSSTGTPSTPQHDDLSLTQRLKDRNGGRGMVARSNLCVIS